MTRTTRRRLPARVYWVRRLMVLGIATLLVVGIARLLGGSSDGSSGPDRAARAAQTSAGASLPAPVSSGTTWTTQRLSGPTKHHRRSSPPPTPLAEPSGPCAPDDVSVTPSVPDPVAGGDISLTLFFSTITSPACDWTMSGRSLAVRITSGPDLIWTTVQCARSIPTQDLVLRNTQPTTVRLTWNAKRSEPGCPKLSAWALPGTYHLRVAALGGQPSETSFVLTAPSPAQVTRTAHPHAGKKQHHQGN